MFLCFRQYSQVVLFAFSFSFLCWISTRRGRRRNYGVICRSIVTTNFSILTRI